jgi:hypothetical protein
MEMTKSGKQLWEEHVAICKAQYDLGRKHAREGRKGINQDASISYRQGFIDEAAEQCAAEFRRRYGRK